MLIVPQKLEFSVKVSMFYCCSLVLSCEFDNHFTLIAHAVSTAYADCGDGDVRLKGSPNNYEGRVEMCINNAWGTVCDDGWGTVDGNVLCAQLGFQPFGRSIFQVKYVHLADWTKLYTVDIFLHSVRILFQVLSLCLMLTLEEGVILL